MDLWYETELCLRMRRGQEQTFTQTCNFPSLSSVVVCQCVCSRFLFFSITASSLNIQHLSYQQLPAKLCLSPPTKTLQCKKVRKECFCENLLYLYTVLLPCLICIEKGSHLCSGVQEQIYRLFAGMGCSTKLKTVLCCFS